MLKINACLFMCNFLISLGIGRHKSLESLDQGECRINSEGNCDPKLCAELGRVCEARFVRFWDANAKVDRTLRSCRCLKQAQCPLAHFGCRNYGELGNGAQKTVRKWTNNEAERRARMGSRNRGKGAKGSGNRNSNTGGRKSRHSKYSDAQRHDALLQGASKFCCQFIVEENGTAKRQTGSSEMLEKFYCPFSKCYLPFIFSFFFSQILY